MHKRILQAKPTIKLHSYCVLRTLGAGEGGHLKGQKHPPKVGEQIWMLLRMPWGDTWQSGQLWPDGSSDPRQG